MKQTDDEDIYVLSTGTTIYANQGVIGIDGNQKLHGGYDDFLKPAGNRGWDGEGFTQAERMEIADFMIRRWQEYRDAYQEALTLKLAGIHAPPQDGGTK